MTAKVERRSLVDNQRLRVSFVVIALLLILFTPIWTTVRFSSLFDRFLSMQGAYDEPFYFWQLYLQITQGVLDIDYRLFSKLLAVVLVSAGLSYDATFTVYSVVNPAAAFAAALVLAATWERWSLGRVMWALFLLFSFDLLSGSSWVINYYPPAAWLASLVGDPALLKADVLPFFLVNRRPEPQSSWVVLFLYWALVLNAFLEGRRRTYLIACAVTPLLAFIYINTAVVAILTFVLLSFCALYFYRRRIAIPLTLSMIVTLAIYAACAAAVSTSTMVSRTAFHTHMPFLRPSIGFTVIGIIWVALAIRRRGLTPARLAALIFFAVPAIVLNQQIVTGIAVFPQNWEFYANYPCIVVAAGLMSGTYLSSFERETGWRQFLSVGLLAFIGFLLVQGSLRTEFSWSRDNVRSVLASEVLSQARTKVGRIDEVVLPSIFDESLFLTRVPPGTRVLGGYNSMVARPVPVWRDEETFADHARVARESFADGFETLFRTGISPNQLQTNMEAELKTGDCWLGLSYFFSLSECWPAFHNFTSPAIQRLPGAVPTIIEMYRRYLEQDAARDLAARQVLLIRDVPLPPDANGSIANELVGSAEIDMRGTTVRAYAYIQRPPPGK